MESIPQWYSGQHVLVTGSTGFMGKVMVEKLLRSCPDIATIYLIIRPKRGKTPTERLQEFVNTPVFDRLRSFPQWEQLFKKLYAIDGDMLQKNLNLSTENLELLRENVTTVFHMAANVRFDQTLKPEVLMNMGGTLALLEVAEKFKSLIAFVHVSTTFCHCDETVLEERVYKAPHDPRKIIDLVSWMDDQLLEKITPDLLQNNPNTYAYTKCLTEQIVVEFATKFPIAIARPSIVIAAFKEPIPGWVDNLNGPTGVLIAAGKGVLRTMVCIADYEADIVPVDIAINSFIILAKELATTPKSDKMLVVNVTNGKDNTITWKKAIEIGKKHIAKNPFSLMLWYPSGSPKSNRTLHMVDAFFSHTIPAYAVDLLMVIGRQKPFLVQVQKRIDSGLKVLDYYTTTRWYFRNDEMKRIRAKLSLEDKEEFFTDINKINWEDYLLDYMLGARQYCLHEDPKTLPRARKLFKRLYYLNLIKNIIFFGLVLWFFYHWTTTILDVLGAIIPESSIFTG